MDKLQLSLQNPVWSSLIETHKSFEIEFDGVKFYDPKICPFGSCLDDSFIKGALNKYAALSDSFFFVSEDKTPVFDESVLMLEKKINGCQMVLDKLIEVEISEKIVPLTEKYIDEIYNLVWSVMPGYYRKGTFNMGKYFGIFKDGKLVSIAGQRMQSNTFIEVSAVVTHPNYTKRGYASQLTTHATKQILKVNKLPILHTNKGNLAIPLYERLGYKISRDMNWWMFRRIEA